MSVCESVGDPLKFEDVFLCHTYLVFGHKIKLIFNNYVILLRGTMSEQLSLGSTDSLEN